MPRSKFVLKWYSFFMGVCAFGILFFSFGFNAPSENTVGRYQAVTDEGVFLILDTSSGEYIRSYTYSTWVFEKFNVPNSQEKYNTWDRKNSKR